MHEILQECLKEINREIEKARPDNMALQVLLELRDNIHRALLGAYRYERYKELTGKEKRRHD
jgi:hypothetical protein